MTYHDALREAARHCREWCGACILIDAPGPLFPVSITFRVVPPGDPGCLENECLMVLDSITLAALANATGAEFEGLAGALLERECRGA